MDPASHPFKLSQHLPNFRPFNTSEIEFVCISTDGSTCSPGDLFIALVTADGDGHNDVQLAIENGAAGILAERLLPIQYPLFLVEDTRTAFSELSQVIYAQTETDTELITIAITGSTAVAATSRLLAHMFETSDCSCQVISTPENSTPQEAFMYQAKSLQELSAASIQYAIVELSAEHLATRLFDTLSFDFLVVTSVENHSPEFDGTTQAYNNSYQRAFERLHQQGVAVLNFADPVTRFEFVPDNRAFLTIGPNDESDIWVQHLEHGRLGQSFIVHAGADSQEIFSPILGHQHVFNCLMSIAVGLLLHLPLRRLCESIRSYKSTPGQLQRVDRGQAFDVYIDRANTAKDLNRAVLALRQITEGKLILVYGPSSEHSKIERAEMGRVAERFTDVSIITENNAAYENPLEIAHDVLDGYLRSADAYIIPGRERAIVFGLTTAESGDTVLIAGKGDNTFDILGNETFYFDDTEIAAICIEEILNPVAKYGRDLFRFEDYADG
ncbi:MAG: hypothetical protein CMJ76_09340 [Planctomycetaceae bacterium]|nr:hypothetical protein [Planctomycetaceae bacterium]